MILDYSRIAGILLGGTWHKVRAGSIETTDWPSVSPIGLSWRRSGIWLQFVDDANGGVVQTILEEIQAIRYDADRPPQYDPPP